MWKPTRKAKISRNEQLIISFEVILYKVDLLANRTSVIRQRTTQRAAVEHSQRKRENKRGRKRMRSMMREITTEWLRLSEGRHFGDWTNENARDRVVGGACCLGSRVCLSIWWPGPWWRQHIPPPWHKSRWPAEHATREGQSSEI